MNHITGTEVFNVKGQHYFHIHSSDVWATVRAYQEKE